MAQRASTPTDPGCAGLHLLFTRLVAVALTFAPLAAPSATLAAPTAPSTPATPARPATSPASDIPTDRVLGKPPRLRELRTGFAELA